VKRVQPHGAARPIPPQENEPGPRSLIAKTSIGSSPWTRLLAKLDVLDRVKGLQSEMNAKRQLQ
jgi:hypothetical protein